MSWYLLKAGRFRVSEKLNLKFHRNCWKLIGSSVRKIKKLRFHRYKCRKNLIWCFTGTVKSCSGWVSYFLVCPTFINSQYMSKYLRFHRNLWKLGGFDCHILVCPTFIYLSIYKSWFSANFIKLFIFHRISLYKKVQMFFSLYKPLHFPLSLSFQISWNVIRTKINWTHFLCLNSFGELWLYMLIHFVFLFKYAGIKKPF